MELLDERQQVLECRRKLPCTRPGAVRYDHVDRQQLVVGQDGDDQPASHRVYPQRAVWPVVGPYRGVARLFDG